MGEQVLVGCSGWNYGDTPDKGGWTGVFYPDKDTKRLRYYSQFFNTAEMDSIFYEKFYSQMTKGTFIGMARATPEKSQLIISEAITASLLPLASFSTESIFSIPQANNSSLLQSSSKAVLIFIDGIVESCSCCCIGKFYPHFYKPIHSIVPNKRWNYIPTLSTAAMLKSCGYCQELI
jgi:hypothetical protein